MFLYLKKAECQNIVLNSQEQFVSSSCHFPPIYLDLCQHINYFSSDNMMIALRDIASLGAHPLVTTVTWTIYIVTIALREAQSNKCV